MDIKISYPISYQDPGSHSVFIRLSVFLNSGWISNLALRPAAGEHTGKKPSALITLITLISMANIYVP